MSHTEFESSQRPRRGKSYGYSMRFLRATGDLFEFNQDVVKALGLWTRWYAIQLSSRCNELLGWVLGFVSSLSEARACQWGSILWIIER